MSKSLFYYFTFPIILFDGSIHYTPEEIQEVIHDNMLYEEESYVIDKCFYEVVMRTEHLDELHTLLSTQMEAFCNNYKEIAEYQQNRERWLDYIEFLFEKRHAEDKNLYNTAAIKWIQEQKRNIKPLVGEISNNSTTFNLWANTSIPMLFYAGASERMRITSAGNVGIGTTNPTSKLTVVGDGVFSQSGSGDVLVLNPLAAGSGANFYVANAAGSAYAPLVLSASKFTLSSGNVGIGVTPGATYKLDVQGVSTDFTINTNGKLQAVSANWTSDQMFKTNVDSLHSSLEIIRQLKPKSYYFDTLNFNGKGKFCFPSEKQYGFIANDIQSILPELVSLSTKPAILDTLGNVIKPAYTYKALNYIGFISILTKGIQELQFNNDSLQSKVNNQDSTIASLQNQITTNNNLLNSQLDQLLTTISTCCTINGSRSIQSSTNNQSQSLIQQIDVKLNDAQAVVLEQNVPNPFAEQTTINYSLPDNTVKAQMLFYNAEGKLIQSTELTQKGKGTLNVFASDLSSGIYTYTLVVDGKIIETRKMVKQ